MPMAEAGTAVPCGDGRSSARQADGHRSPCPSGLMPTRVFGAAAAALRQLGKARAGVRVAVVEAAKTGLSSSFAGHHALAHESKQAGAACTSIPLISLSSAPALRELRWP